jgi:SAM-dependent methyltransferase
MHDTTTDTREGLLSALSEVKRQHGEWTYDIPLPFDVWTKGNKGLPHTRLKRIVQMAVDLVGKPLDQCRVLDLACLDGQFAIEFALRGARSVGIEIRPSHVAKARFCAGVLGLHNLVIHQDDVRNLSTDKYGRFDIVVCSGILYHLLAQDAIDLVYKMHDVADRLVLIDTEHSLRPQQEIQTPKGRSYAGHAYREHAEGATDDQKQASGWASWDNTTSFWFSRPSLANLLQDAGFSSVYECLAPVHLNYGQPGLETATRITLVAVKGSRVDLVTSPTAALIQEDVPEGLPLSVPLDAALPAKRRGLLSRVLSEIGSRPK